MHSPNTTQKRELFNPFWNLYNVKYSNIQISQTFNYVFF